MSADFLRAIDWERPWLTPYKGVGTSLASASDWRGLANEMVQGTRNAGGQQISFVPQSTLPPGTAYEAFIFATGMVPTRDGLHDFFNALVWLTFPKVKVQLNARQAREIEARGGTGAARGKVRDAATLFDENAALLAVRDPELLKALRAHQWQEIFVDSRDAFCRDAHVILFGHALMEKLVAPYKAITAHAWPVLVQDGYFQLSPAQRIEELDMHIASELEGSLDPSAFTPLPVLGVPGWCHGQDRQFYADETVFRPKRTQR